MIPKVIRKELQTWRAALDPNWNWRGMRAPDDLIGFPADNLLPTVSRNFLINLEGATGGKAVIYGGALNDLAHGIAPKDYDTYLLTERHPLLTMRQADYWARERGYRVRHYRRRVRLLWKRLIIETQHGDYDIGILYNNNKTSHMDFARFMSGEADIGTCARSATATKAFEAQRCIEGEASSRLIFRPLETARNRFRHLDRWHKNAIVKYPARSVVYRDPADALIFAALNDRREEFMAYHAELTKQTGAPPKDFEPFRPLMPELYDQLKAQAQHQLT